MTLKLNGTTSGSVSLDAPATGSDVSFTLPGSVGSSGQLLSTNGSGVLSFVNGGKILQVVNAAYSTELLTTSGTAVDTGLTATITPTAASSKILVHMNLQYNGQNSDIIWGRLLRGATTIVGNSRICNSAGVTSWDVNYLDTPNTTSSTTYKAQVYKDTGGGTSFICQWNNQQTSTMTLIEVAA